MVAITTEHNELGCLCRECGIAANVVTCLKKYGMPPKQLAYSVSTFHKGICAFCGEEKDVTEQRDFFYPDLALLVDYREAYERRKK